MKLLKNFRKTQVQVLPDNVIDLDDYRQQQMDQYIADWRLDERATRLPARNDNSDSPVDE